MFPQELGNDHLISSLVNGVGPVVWERRWPIRTAAEYAAAMPVDTSTFTTSDLESTAVVCDKTHGIREQRMPTSSAAEDASVLQSPYHASTIASAAATACLIWYIVVAVVCSIGYVQLYALAANHRDITTNLSAGGGTTLDRFRGSRGLEAHHM